jgi:hypothetical protein
MKRAQSKVNGRPCCRTCKHWLRDDVVRQLEINGTTYTDDRGLCRRLPPVPLVVQNVVKTRFPLTHPTAACGEYLGGD